MPIHLRTNWLITENLQFAYFARYDSFADKNLEQRAEINYTKGRNAFAASYHKNLRKTSGAFYSKIVLVNIGLLRFC